MRKQYQKLQTIKYAVVCSMIASFGVVAVAGLFFGFHFDRWSEWQGGLVGVTGSIAGVGGALFGVFMTLDHPTRGKHS